MNLLKKGGRFRKSLPYLLLAVIVLYTLIYSLTFVGGPSFYGDDTTYLDLAHSVLAGTFQQSQFIFSVRILQFLPISFFYAIFGVSMYTSSAWDILAFSLTVVVAFYLGRELYDERAGLISALLLAFFPMAVELGATVSDDITMMFMTSLAMLLLLMARNRSSKRLYALAGAALVASPLVTPEGGIIIFVALLYLLLEFARKKLDRSAYYLFIGMLAAGGLLVFFNSFTGTNPFVTLTTNSNFYSAVGQKNTIPSTNTDPGFYISAMFPYQLVSIAQSALNGGGLNIFQQLWATYVNNYNTQMGFYFYAFVIAALCVGLRRTKGAYYPLLWFVAGFLYLEFGPMHVSLSPFVYLLSYRLQRFLLLLPVPLVVTIGIALSSVLRTKRKVKQYAAVVAVCLAVVFLIATSVPLNIYQYQTLSYEKYDQVVIANYLSTIPNTTSIYRMSGFSNIDSYMQFRNINRIYAYDSIQNCSNIPAGSYVMIPKNMSVFNLDYTPDPQKYCPNWQLVLIPKYPYPLPETITMSNPFGAKLYYIPVNETNSTRGQQAGSQTNTTITTTGQALPGELNYFNLTGTGYRNQTTGQVSGFVTVNNVSSVDVSLNRSSANPGETVRINVTFVGEFKWYQNNATIHYLGAPLINVHYFGVELSNQSGTLYDQNNGPWNYFVSQLGEPHQLLYENGSRYLRVSWNITPRANVTGKQIKICGGYFATYQNTTLFGGWGALYNTLSMRQERVVNSTVISIPSSECSYLNVT